MTQKSEGKDPREEAGPYPAERKGAGGEARFREPGRVLAGEGPRGGDESSRRPGRPNESLLWNRSAGSAAAAEMPPRERRSPSLRAETGAALERELLLVDSLGGEVLHPRVRRRLGALAAAAVVLALGATAAIFFVQVRSHWKEKLAAAQGELDRARKDGEEREAGWKRQGEGMAREIEERKTESRNSSQIADKTLVELKTALDDVRRSRDENRKLEAELRAALARRSGGLLEVLKRYSSVLAPPSPAAIPAASR